MKAHIIDGLYSFRAFLLTGIILSISVFLFLLFNTKFVMIILYIIKMIVLLLVSFNNLGIIRRFKSEDIF